MQEGFEKVVLNLLKRDKIGGYFSNGKLYVDMRDMEDTKASMKDAMKQRDISQMPSIVGEANESKLDLVDTVRNTMFEAKLRVYRVTDKNSQGNVHAKNEKEAIKKAKEKGLKDPIKVTDKGVYRGQPTLEMGEELDEVKEKGPRQLVDPKKEVMVVKKNKVVVIDKKDQSKYEKQGWSLAESLDEGDPDFGPVKGKKVKTVNMKHKTSGKEVVVVDNPKKIKEMERGGFVIVEGFADYKSMAKEIKKDLGRKVSERDISDWIQDNVDDPHKTDPDEVADELKKVGVRVEGLEEGTWLIPKGVHLKGLKKLLTKPLILGKDGDNASEVMYSFIGDDELLDDIYAAGKKDPKGDARPLIRKAMKRLGIKENRESILDTIGKIVQERKNG